MKKIAICTLALIGLTLAAPKLTKIGGHSLGITGEGVTEIPTYDSTSKKLFVASAQLNGILVYDFKNPATPVLIDTVVFAGAAGHRLSPNSVSAYKGNVAVALEDTDTADVASVKYVRQNNGFVAVLNAQDANHAEIKRFNVGALPDMVTFSEDGQKIVTANEGEPSKDYKFDPEGSISVINVSGGIANGTVTTLDFKSFNADSTALMAKGVILDRYNNAKVAQDLEPEYVAMNAAGTRAWVTLQENNAVALVDLVNLKIDSIVALPKKDVNVAGQGMDLLSNKKAEVKNFAVKSLLMPDGIAHLSSNNKSYLLIANEGDARDYGTGFVSEIKISKASGWDTTAVPKALIDTLKASANGDLTIHANVGIKNGVRSEINVFGGRSFSVLDSTGKLIWDSGDQFEQKTATALPLYFNASNSAKAFTLDDRSSKKGPEPEGVVIGKSGAKTYAFIGLERIGGIMVYDVTVPTAPVFVEYVNVRDFSATVFTSASLGPEGLIYIPADKSPNGQNLLVVANEVSGNLDVFSFSETTNNLKAKNELLQSAPAGRLVIRQLNGRVVTIRENVYVGENLLEGLQPGQYFVEFQGKTQNIIVK
jgi:hypothetical protein